MFSQDDLKQTKHNQQYVSFDGMNNGKVDDTLYVWYETRLE